MLTCLGSLPVWLIEHKSCNAELSITADAMLESLLEEENMAPTPWEASSTLTIYASVPLWSDKQAALKDYSAVPSVTPCIPQGSNAILLRDRHLHVRPAHSAHS